MNRRWIVNKIVRMRLKENEIKRLNDIAKEEHLDRGNDAIKAFSRLGYQIVHT